MGLWHGILIGAGCVVTVELLAALGIVWLLYRAQDELDNWHDDIP